MKVVIKRFFVGVLILSQGALFAGNSDMNALALGADGTILAAGFANNDVNRTTDFAFARYLPDGSLDTTFNPEGPVPGLLQIDNSDFVQDVSLDTVDEGITGVTIDATGCIVGVGFSTIGLNSRIAVIRLTPEGALDTSFNADGALGVVPGLALIDLGEFVDVATDVAIDSLGRIVVVGSTDNGVHLDLVVLRLTPEGELDMSFNTESENPGIFVFDLNENDVVASSVALNDDDTIVVGGTNNVGTNTNFLILKLTEAGAFDATFNALSVTPGIIEQDFQGLDDQAFSLKIDSKKRIVIGGFSDDGTQISLALARYTPEGILDVSFNALGLEPGVPGTVITTIVQSNSVIRSLAIAAGDKIVVTGFTDDLTDKAFLTARYSEDGSLDTTFSGPGPRPGIVVTQLDPMGEDQVGSNNEAHAIIIDAEDKPFVGGFSFDGLQNNFTLINYLTDGQLNTDFNPEGIGSFIPGVVITLFGESLTTLGNGVPEILFDDISGVDPMIIEQLAYPPQPQEPTITTDLSEPFTQRQLSFVGTASPNSAVLLYLDNEQIGQVSATTDGLWSFTLPPLEDGSYSMVVKSVDLLSGVSLSSKAEPFSIMSQGSLPPRIESPGPNQVVTTTSPVITGSGTTGDTITLYLDDSSYATAEVTTEGTWRVETDELSEGAHTLSARAQRDSGAESDATEPITFTIRQSTEQAPEISAPRSGLITDKRVLLQGKAQPNAQVSILSGTNQIGTARANAQGAWQYTFTAKPGNYELSAASQNGKTSETVRVTLEQPVAVASGAITNPEGLLNGKAQPGSQVKLFVDNRLIGTSLVGAQGTWSYTPVGKQPFKGAHPVKIVITDTQGRVRTLEQNITF